MDKDLEIQRLLEENEQLRKENAELKARTIELEKLVKVLQNQISNHITKKNSNNSSIPPSTDLTRKTRSLRISGGRKPGGQKGHPGKTLNMTETPDEIHKILPDYCNVCGKELTEIEAKFEGKRTGCGNTTCKTNLYRISVL